MPKSHPDYDALYAAVCAAPEDDTPRLVLADWLDEHDDPHRAAYIRAEVQLHRLREDDPEAAALERFNTLGDPSWDAYYDHAAVAPTVARMAALKRLSAAHEIRAKARWKSVLGRRRHGDVFAFERGFPHTIAIRDAQKYAATQPPENLPEYSFEVFEANDTSFDALLACPNFASAKGISLYNVLSPEPVRKLGAIPAVRNFRRLSLDNLTDHPDVLAAIATQPNWGGLTKLFIRLGGLGDLPDAFAGATHLRGLTELVIGSGRLSSAGLSHLARLGLPRLRCFNFEFNSLDAGDMRTLAAGAFAELRYLNLCANPLESAGAEVLAGSVARASLPRVVALDVSGCRIADAEPMSALIAGPCFPNLIRLDVSFNPVEELDAKTLAGRGPSLRFLSLARCGLSAEAVRLLGSAPALAHLLCIDLTAGECGNDGAAAIAESKWDRLTYLSLEQNGITGAGVKALTSWPGLSRLQYLNLNGNPIGLAGAKALVAAKAALKNCRRLVVPRVSKQLPKDGRELLQKAFGRRLWFF